MWSTFKGLVDTLLSVDQETEDVLISEILVSQRGERGLAVCFVPEDWKKADATLSLTSETLHGSHGGHSLTPF